MKPQLHIISVGTSILTNFSRSQNQPSAYKTASAYLAANPTQASAEINSLHAKTNFLADTKASRKLSISLIFSETADGKKAATLIKKFLKDKVSAIQMIPLVGIDRASDAAYSQDDAQSMAEKSLADLQTKLRKHIEKMKPVCQSVQINISGGFKAEAAVIYAIGCSQSVPVYYLHESFKTCVNLPAEYSDISS
ncbi:MAG: putative CRISPR-associated protein [Verrucomicrobia bacterium]|nr:MAG: putative CRISPR-associated protein [Verrucomicrobiota bacterium]